jgi:putative copper export protein
LNDFAVWLSTTLPSVFIQNHEVWMIPVIQSLHIVGIAIAVGSTLMMTLRVLGWVGTDQTVLSIQRRFGPWLTGALGLLLASGGLLIVAEPVRELVTFSFWLKMVLVAVLTALAAMFQASVRHRDQQWEQTLVRRKSVRLAAVIIFVVLGCIIILGRLIAYDHIWGHLSPATKA